MFVTCPLVIRGKENFEHELGFSFTVLLEFPLVQYIAEENVNVFFSVRKSPRLVTHKDK